MKYNIGDKVLIEVEIIDVDNSKGIPFYTIDRKDWHHHLHISEKNIVSKVNRKGC